MTSVTNTSTSKHAADQIDGYSSVDVQLWLRLILSLFSACAGEVGVRETSLPKPWSGAYLQELLVLQVSAYGADGLAARPEGAARLIRHNQVQVALPATR